MTKSATDLHKMRKKPDCPGCQDQGEFQIKLEQLRQAHRKVQGKLQKVEDANEAVQGQNAIIEALAECDPGEIRLCFLEAPDPEANVVEDAKREEHVITFDRLSGHKLKTLVMLLMESASLRLELELRDAMAKAQS